jgi:hypothetical protein
VRARGETAAEGWTWHFDLEVDRAVPDEGLYPFLSSLRRIEPPPEPTVTLRVYRSRGLHTEEAVALRLRPPRDGGEYLRVQGAALAAFVELLNSQEAR